MNRIKKKLLLPCLIIIGILSLTGCTNLMEEDPNEQQIPWATPADWEGQVPGMPGSPGSGF